MNDDYNKKQRQYEEVEWQRYNLAPVVLTPAQEFYCTVEVSRTVELLHRHGLADVDRLLVCGVGGGDDLQYWLGHLRVRRCIGLDFAMEGVRAAQRRVAHEKLPNLVEYMQADIESIPLRDDSVDLVLVRHALHHLADPRRGVRELFRVARRGIAVVEPADTFLMPLFQWIGLARRTEEMGNVVLRFQAANYHDYLNGYSHSLEFRKCLYYYHPWINGRLIRFFDFPGGVSLLRGLHGVASVLFFFLRSKGVAVITKDTGGAGS